MFSEEIMSKIKEAGFHIAAKKETELTEEIAKEFYKEHEGKEYYGDLTQHMARCSDSHFKFPSVLSILLNACCIFIVPES